MAGLRGTSKIPLINRGLYTDPYQNKLEEEKPTEEKVIKRLIKVPNRFGLNGEDELKKMIKKFK